MRRFILRACAKLLPQRFRVRQRASSHRRHRDPRAAIGRRAEWVARWWLRLRGFHILAVRYRTPFAEVDLVAVQGPDLVVVEVKSRRGGEITLHPDQRARLVRAALWIDARFGRGGSGIRVDLVSVQWTKRGYPSLQLDRAAIGEEELRRPDF